MGVLTGCRCGNYQDCTKGNLSTGGSSYLGWGQYYYGTLSIGTEIDPFIPFTQTHQFRAPLTRWYGFILEPIHTGENSKIAGIKNKKIAPQSHFVTYELSCGAYPNQIVIGFSFYQERLITFYYCCDSFADETKIHTQIGTADGKNSTRWPLRDRDFETLFGTPEIVNKSWIW